MYIISAWAHTVVRSTVMGSSRASEGRSDNGRSTLFLYVYPVITTWAASERLLRAASLYLSWHLATLQDASAGGVPDYNHGISYGNVCWKVWLPA